jgi:hypothetical protein
MLGGDTQKGEVVWARSGRVWRDASSTSEARREYHRERRKQARKQAREAEQAEPKRIMSGNAPLTGGHSMQGSMSRHRANR